MAARTSPLTLLRRLERIQAEFGGDAGARKLELLRRLGRARMPTAKAVLRLHEAVCFLRAYPDDRAVLAEVERLLASFAGRADLRRHADALCDSGIAGTEIRYLFFASMARWLVAHWPERMRIDWDEFGADGGERLEAVLPLLATWSETPGLDEHGFEPREWIEMLKGPRETDAGFVVRRIAALRVDEFVHESFYERVGLPLILSAGPGTPSRTRARHPVRRVVFQRGPMRRGRPEVRRDVDVPPLSIVAVSRAQGQRLIDLAREAMVTRSRDLDVFAHGDPRDVRVADCGDGLQFAIIGARPERRLVLEAVYGFLTLRNGVPIGYVLNSALLGSAEIAYNVFETWRGGEAGWVYGRVLALVRALFGVDTFTIYPYQLGHENEEGLASGAWWFYRKLGFEPHDPGALRIAAREEARIAKNPRHRSSRSTLEKLAEHNMFFHLGRRRGDVIGEFPLGDVGLGITRTLAERFGADREGGEETCAREAARLLGVRTQQGWSAGEKLWWRRWAPLVMSLPGVQGWAVAERRALAEVVRSKGGRRESDFVVRFDAHRKLRRALAALARRSAVD